MDFSGWCVKKKYYDTNDHHTRLRETSSMSADINFKKRHVRNIVVTNGETYKKGEKTQKLSTTDKERKNY